MTKILVIQNKRIGDVLLASLIAENIKLIYPDSYIEYMVYDYTADVIKNHPQINNIIEINEASLKKIPNLIKTALATKKAKYDIIFDPYAKFQSRFICLLSKAKIRVGFKKKDKNPLLPVYTNNIPLLKEKSLPCGKSIEDRVHLVNAVFSLKTPIYNPKIHLTLAEKNYSKLDKYNKPVVMFGVLGSTPQKSMPSKYIAKLIDFVLDKYHVYALFNYAPHQQKEAYSIYEMCNNKDRVIFDIYEDSIRGFIKLINKCALLIANEGGAVHIAKALNKPTFTIFSPYVLKAHYATFDDGKLHASVHLLEEKPNLFTAENKEERREIEKNPNYLYQQLTPEIITPKLEQFLKHHF